MYDTINLKFYLYSHDILWALIYMLRIFYKHKDKWQFLRHLYVHASAN